MEWRKKQLDDVKIDKLDEMATGQMAFGRSGYWTKWQWTEWNHPFTYLYLLQWLGGKRNVQKMREVTGSNPIANGHV